MTTNKPGRYQVQVFDLNGRRKTGHHCDGTYDLIFDALQAVTVGIAEPNVSSILIRDQLRIDEMKPRPLGEILGATETVGSCESRPLIRWDKTQQTWHTDVDKVGRYSVRRLAKYQPYGAYLNGNRIAVDEHQDVEVVKRAVELRIVEARRIANGLIGRTK